MDLVFNISKPDASAEDLRDSVWVGGPIMGAALGGTVDGRPMYVVMEDVQVGVGWEGVEWSGVGCGRMVSDGVG